MKGLWVAPKPKAERERERERDRERQKFQQIMEQRTDFSVFLSLFLCLLAGGNLPTLCEGRSSKHLKSSNPSFMSFKQVNRGQEIKAVKHLGSFSMAYPFSFPPFDAAMGPSSSPQDFPPYCIYPPPLPPTGPLQSSPPPPSFGPGSPFVVPSPPGFQPIPPGFQPSPPIFVPTPPIILPTPPGYAPIPPTPSPPEFVPGPPLFLPPVIYPPPSVPPPPHEITAPGLWCVAKPTVPDPIIQEAMNYACGSGADCDAIEPNGSCYQPDTLLAHASFAFNSYWQRTKVAGATCDFGGTAMLITRDPSYDGCQFILS
ncbi:Glucan endo-1,3-beta-glucosidase 4 [Apostasia shenzhenica]|uniref:Glucan endo-1,3-beta-glucosidase 4 n=1 Tax=Apostasia shenzhenica TaxID=1088818 RepID=A0A2H9ZTP5_9ASPA|nr:Glucan endo-1,3-beta-glucosidase 4 [Apostasia shenzhenica]